MLFHHLWEKTMDLSVNLMNEEYQEALEVMNNRNGQKKTMSKYPGIFKGLLLIQAAEDQGQTV